MTRAERDESRANELLAGLNEVGWTEDTIRSALLRAIGETRGRALSAVARYKARNMNCLRRKSACKVIADEITLDDKE
jgi:hypothetical protein